MGFWFGIPVSQYNRLTFSTLAKQILAAIPVWGKLEAIIIFVLVLTCYCGSVAPTYLPITYRFSVMLLSRSAFAFRLDRLALTIPCEVVPISTFNHALSGRTMPCLGALYLFLVFRYSSYVIYYFSLLIVSNKNCLNDLVPLRII